MNLYTAPGTPVPGWPQCCEHYDQPSINGGLPVPSCPTSDYPKSESGEPGSLGCQAAAILQEVKRHDPCVQQRRETFTGPRYTVSANRPFLLSSLITTHPPASLSGEVPTRRVRSAPHRARDQGGPGSEKRSRFRLPEPNNTGSAAS